MKIKELVELVGAYECVRIVDSNYNEIVRCVAVEIPAEVGEKFIKSIYSKNSTINIVALDKPKRKWYNGKGNDAESPRGKGITL